jgi:NAD(P)-dependent dehydrogenase (short-subunit alcohol dehydrogenase family)
VPIDLGGPDGPALLIAQALDAHGRLDVLVNNVGAVRIRSEGFLGTSDEEFEWAMQLNFFSALRATRAAITHMAEAGGGAIVNVCSVNAFFQPDAGTIDYGAAKAALLNLSKSLAQEFGAKGIHVNCVSPGPVTTELWLGDHGVAATVAAATGVDEDTARAAVVASIGGFATGRFTSPEEVATLVVLLASQRTANVTGANYVIDGGLIKTT